MKDSMIFDFRAHLPKLSYVMAVVCFASFVYAMFQPIPTGDVIRTGRDIQYVEPIFIEMYMPLLYLQATVFFSSAPTFLGVVAMLRRVHTYTVPVN